MSSRSGQGPIPIIFAMLLVFVLTGSAFIGGCINNPTVEDRLNQANATLQALEDTIPELVLSGDLTQADADSMISGINKAQKVFTDAQKLGRSGLPQDPLEQIDLAIAALREVQKDVTGERAKRDVGRTIAALTLSRSFITPSTSIKSK